MNDLRKPSQPLVELDDALQTIQSVVPAISDHELYNLSDCLRRVAALPVKAPRTLPSFDNSSVDGFAFRYEDVAAQTRSKLKIIGQSLAGQPFVGRLEAGTTVRIATGAKVPTGADTIVMQEDCSDIDGLLSIHNNPVLGSCIRRIGSDFHEGRIAIPAGRLLEPQDIALAGALGVTELDVVRAPKVAIFSTGAELKPVGCALAPGQIADTNGLMLQQLLSTTGIGATLKSALPDNYEATRTALMDAANENDLIVTSGGVSVGSHDYVREVLHTEGRVFFWRLAIRPGKPVLFAKIGKCFVTCLPGNPVSALVTFFLITVPLLKCLLGNKHGLAPAFLVPLGESFTKDLHLRSFPRARMECKDGLWQAIPYHDQSSHLIGSLSGTDGLLDLPIGETHFPAHVSVMFRPFKGLMG